MLEYVQKLRQQGGLMKVRSAHTAGSIIRAYGAMGDIKGVWDTWNELRLHGEKEAGGRGLRILDENQGTLPGIMYALPPGLVLSVIPVVPHKAVAEVSRRGKL